MPLDLTDAGIARPTAVHRNLHPPRLIQLAIERGEGVLAEGGSLVTRTGQYTGRSPHDKMTVNDASTADAMWWGDENKATTPEVFDALHGRIAAYLQGRELFVQDCFAGHDPDYRLPVRVVTERAWHNLFARNMFIQPSERELEAFEPDFTVLQAPGFQAQPERDGTNSEAAIIIDFTRRMVLICGTEYAGEIKKSIFTALNFMLPPRGVLGMHCSSNIGEAGDTALFFGLSGTGKTTLSADPARALIGDDEHGWSDNGIYNFEGGCYAKVIRLSQEAEPEIFATTSKFGTLLENVVLDETTRRPDFDDNTFAENTRASYDISAIPNVAPGCRGSHPTNIVMLTCDAFGVMPPLARMNPAQAMYHFLSGYTAKVAGTERGVTEPRAVFSACFGAPFMARHPTVYAKMLGDNIAQHNVNCWLVNTGWTGGPPGVGKRMSIQWTRRLLNAALAGELQRAHFVTHPVFRVEVPSEVAGVPSEVLDPRATWQDKAAYDAKATHLAGLFRANFEQYAAFAGDSIVREQPRVD